MTTRPASSTQSGDDCSRLARSASGLASSAQPGDRAAPLATAHGSRPPDAGPAPAWRRVLTHAAFETRIMLSNGEQIMVAILMPLGVLIALHLLPVGRVEGAVPLHTALAAAWGTAVVSSSLTSQAIQTGFDRRNGVLRWVATTPLGRSGYLAGKIVSLLTVQVLQIALLLAVTALLGQVPSPAGIAAAIPVWLLGSVAFGGLGLLLAGTLRTEAVLAGSNVLFVLFVAVGGIALPPVSFPRLLRSITDLLPSGALGDLLRATLADGPFSWGSVLILLVWAVLLSLAATRWFRWTSR